MTTRVSARRFDLVAAILAAMVSCACGAVIAYGQYKLAPLALGGAVGLAVAARLALRPSLLRFATYLLAAAAVALIATNGLRFNASTTYSDLLIVVATGALGFAIVAGERSPRIPGWMSVGAVLIVVSALTVEMFPARSLSPDLVDFFRGRNLATGDYSSTSNLMTAVRLLFALILVPIVVGLAPTSWRQAHVLVNLWLGGVAASCAVGVLAAFTSIDIQETLTGVGYSQEATSRVSGLAVHPTTLGLTAAMALPVAFSRMVTSSHRRLYTPLVTLYVAAALVSGSRSAVVLCAVGFLLVFAWQYRARRQLVLIAGGTTAALVALWSTIQPLSSIQRLIGTDTITGQTAQRSDAGHYSRISEGMQAFLERPIGYGFQAVRSAHNVALQLLDSGGLFALIGYVIVIYGAVRLGWWLRTQVPHALEADVIGLVASLSVWVATSVVTSASFDRYLYIPIGLLLALYFVGQRTSRPAMSTSTQHLPLRRSGAGYPPPLRRRGPAANTAASS